MFYHLLPVWEMRKLYSCSLKMELTLELKIIWVCAGEPGELRTVDLDTLNQTLSSVHAIFFSYYKHLWDEGCEEDESHC